MNPLTQVVTISEASDLWGLDSSTLRWAIRRGRFDLDEFRKSGKEWLILKDAMYRVYGKTKEELLMIKVRELLSKFDMDALVNYMDDDIRERVHIDLAPCENAKFLARYMELHLEKYGEEFTVG